MANSTRGYDLAGIGFNRRLDAVEQKVTT